MPAIGFFSRTVRRRCATASSSCVLGPAVPSFAVYPDEPLLEPFLAPMADRRVGDAEPTRDRVFASRFAEAKTICARRTKPCTAECEPVMRSSSSRSGFV
jgi:hypothetical protein